MKRLSAGVGVMAVAVALLVAPPAAAYESAAQFDDAGWACAEMGDHTVPAARIGLPTSGAVVDAAVVVAATGSMPEYCKIDGRILPIDPDAPPIRFALAAPSLWNGMSWQIGGGGLNGTVPDVTSASVTLPGVPGMLAQNYATFGSDSGHDVGDFSWWLNEEAFRNFAHEEIKKTHDTAMAILEDIYGERSSVHYWQGRSQGGRGGLEAVTHYPEDFEGVAVQVPLADFSSSFPNRAVRMTEQLEPGHWIPQSKGRTIIADRVFTLCDDLDGAHDGVINNYGDCTALLDPATNPGAFDDLLCESGGDTGAECLSAGQIETLEHIYGGYEYPYELAYGRTSYVGWGPGTERGNWLLTSEQPVAGSNGTERLDMNHTVVFSGAVDPEYSLVGKSLADIEEPMLRLSTWMDVAPDISGWVANGGKLIMTTSASDTSSNPRAQMELYERWIDAHGLQAVTEHVKYYILPQQDHGTGAILDANGIAIPGRVDLQSALVEWVEGGIEPGDSLTAYTMATAAPYAVTASKPVCTYPLYPHHDGVGSLTDAASYECMAPGSFVPQVVTAPVLAGSADVGSTLSVSSGEWDANGGAVSFEWLRGGAPIAGETASTYTVRPVDRGAILSARVTSTSPLGISGSAVSNERVVTVPSAVVAIPKPLLGTSKTKFSLAVTVLSSGASQPISGEVQAIVNGRTFTAPVVNGKAQIDAGTVRAGIHPVVVSYSGEGAIRSSQSLSLLIALW